MTISAATMRWMAACGLLAGATMIGARVAQLLSGGEGSGAGVLALPVAVLAIASVLALYAQHRHTSKCSTAGLVLMLLGWAGIALSTIAFMAESEHFSWYLLSTLGFLIFVPVAFILLGIGLPKPQGYLPLIVGCYLIGQMLGGTVVALAFPPAAFLFSNEAATIVMGLGLLAMGYNVYTGTKSALVLSR